jgi:NADPH:quinone reductase-like Zn-dependent oxidoreductase
LFSISEEIARSRGSVARSPTTGRLSSLAARAAVAGSGESTASSARWWCHASGRLSRGENSKDLDTLRDLIKAGAVTPVIDRICSLAEVPDAIRHLDAGRVRGKLVVAV